MDEGKQKPGLFACLRDNLRVACFHGCHFELIMRVLIGCEYSGVVREAFRLGQGKTLRGVAHRVSLLHGLRRRRRPGSFQPARRMCPQTDSSIL